MELSISGRHVDVTDAMREHARERVEKLERYAPHLMRISITLSIEGDRHAAEMVASVKRHSDLVAKCETHDMYEAIDQTVDKLDKQLRKVEDRVKDHREAMRPKRVEEPLEPEDDNTLETDEWAEENEDES